MIGANISPAIAVQTLPDLIAERYALVFGKFLIRNP